MLKASSNTLHGADLMRMEAHGEPTRDRAILRLVAATHEGRMVTLDCVVAASDGAERWQTRSAPIALDLELPDAAWMASALAQLLVEWAGEDAMVEVTIVSYGFHSVARIGRADSVVSLELAPPGVDRPA